MHTTQITHARTPARSTALELWQGHACAQSEFRTRYWASTSFVRLAVIEPLCLLEHLTLNATTKSDPDGVRLRAAEGLSASDYWLGEEGMFWLWLPLIRALSDVGYTPKQLHMAAFDWRLSPRALEQRDAFFSSTVARIEALVRINGGQRAVLVSHSMGATVCHYLLNFAEHHRGRGWVDKHIEVVAGAGPTHLGAPKALAGVTSGVIGDFMPVRDSLSSRLA